MDFFGAATRDWFNASFPAPTEVQRQGWAQIAAGGHALLIAPTGSGKTLAAFLWSIDRLTRESAAERSSGVRVLYVSPLKALVYDVERNLRRPLAGIAKASDELELNLHMPRIAVRTGDTSPRARRQQLRDPAEILVTTPESLYLLLTSKARETLKSVEIVIIDEVHSLAPTKRGAHLALSLERLSHLTDTEPQRIGLSATARPTDEVARFLGGDRPVHIVDTSAPPAVDLRIVVPVDDMTRPDAGIESSDQRPGEKGMWPAIHPRLIELIREHTTTIIFVNSRGLCERLTHRLNDLAGEVLVRSHHGSIAHRERTRIEEALGRGEIRCIVATSSLELGIDMGAVDLVILVETPSSVASGLQRVGRAGHQVGEVSVGRMFPKHRGDLLQAAVIAGRMATGAIEALALPQNPLDVLAQQIVAAVATGDWNTDELRALVGRAANFRELPQSAFDAVLDMLAGRYPSHAFSELRPRLNWDRDSGQLTARRGAKLIAILSGGTIPDRGTYAVHLGDDGPRLGELDEEMVHETTPGQTFTLGASTWRVQQVTRDRVIVSPAPGEQGKLPFWHGAGPGRPLELGRALGAMVRELSSMAPEKAADTLMRDHFLDARAAANLLAYLDEQHELTGTLPTDSAVTIERFRDELGDWRVCILTPFGARLHAPWALALEAQLAADGRHIETLWTDDGIALRLDDSPDLPTSEQLVPDPDDVEQQIIDALGSSALFAGAFRENAARALLLPRRRPGQRTPLWLQRLKSQQLLEVAQQFPSFPIIMETYRSCVQDLFDVPALIDILRAIRRRDIVVHEVETPRPSPFARSLIFAYVAANLYEGDVPLAERRARALSLDRELLRELLGADELRKVLDTEVIAAVEDEEQQRTEDRRARDANELHDLLRRLGDLSAEDIARRCVEDSSAQWTAELISSTRAIRLIIAAEPRVVAAEDAGLYRDGLGIERQPGRELPTVFLEERADAAMELVSRFARHRGPFTTTDVAQRFDLARDHAQRLLGALEQRGVVLRGAYRPEGSGIEWCHAEVLRRIKRRTLAKLRGEVAPVDGASLASFLPQWHGVSGTPHSTLDAAIERLAGIPLPFSELERAILPARVANFSPRMLDELGAVGDLVWVGRGALGARDGRVALYRRGDASMLLEPPVEIPELSTREAAIVEMLTARGASFTSALLDALPDTTIVDLEAALRRLVWAGIVTNDTFQALRALSRPPTKNNRRPRHSSTRGHTAAAAGRWSLVSELCSTRASATEKLHARTWKLLARHGVLCRESLQIEGGSGGFSAVYPVLRAMEEAGKIRRGYFVDGLGGAQFALPGAVDQLRACRHQSSDDATVLAAVDPSNPYGWLLPWPGDARESSAGPRRVSGARLIVVAGAATLYLDSGARRVLSFPETRCENRLARTCEALRSVAAQARGRTLRIETIDGEPARDSELSGALRDAGFYADHRHLVLEV